MTNKRSAKSVLAVILSMVLILSAAPVVFAAADYDETGATTFNFSDSEITVTKGDYTDYKVSGTELSIKGAGTYILTGSCSDGSVVVKKGVTGVTLILDGLTLTSSDTAPLTCNKSSAAVIVVKEGTVNTLTDSSYNNDDNYPENENAENAVIKCKDGSNVTICGEGTLNVVSNGKNGIKSGETTEAEGEASLTIKDVTLNIATSVNDGINAEATLNILSGNITVSAADDGIHSDYYLNVGAEGTDGPVIRITKSYEGLEGATIVIYSGDIEIHSEDDGVNAANSDLTDYNFSMTFSGGTVVVYASNGDGVDSNGDITVNGGTLIVQTGNKADNQPLDADGTISIESGTVFAAGSSAGMGAKISASQPYISVGTSTSGGRGGFGMISNIFSHSSSKLNVEAGTVITIKGSAGNVIYTATAKYKITNIIFTCDELVDGEAYTIYAGDTQIASVTASLNGSASGCSCLCHQDGILSIIWRVFTIVFKIFGINQTCSCGAAHY